MEIIVLALPKLISVLKLNPQRMREHHLVGKNGSMVPAGWKAVTNCWDHAAFKQQEITSWKNFQVLFYLLQLCLEQFSHALPSAGCYHPSNEHWKGFCSTPALCQPQVRGFGANCCCCCCWRWFAVRQQGAEKEVVILLYHLSHVFSMGGARLHCHSCSMDEAMFLGRINSVIDRSSWLQQHYLCFRDLLHSSAIPSFSSL